MKSSFLEVYVGEIILLVASKLEEYYKELQPSSISEMEFSYFDEIQNILIEFIYFTYKKEETFQHHWHLMVEFQLNLILIGFKKGDNLRFKLKSIEILNKIIENVDLLQDEKEMEKEKPQVVQKSKINLKNKFTKILFNKNRENNENNKHWFRIKSQYLLNWIKKHQILSEIIKKDSHSIIIEHSIPFLKFLLAKNEFNKNIITQLFDFLKNKHESEKHSIFNSVIQISSLFTYPLILHSFNQFKLLNQFSSNESLFFLSKFTPIAIKKVCFFIPFPPFPSILFSNCFSIIYPSPLPLPFPFY